MRAKSLALVVLLVAIAGAGWFFLRQSTAPNSVTVRDSVTTDREALKTPTVAELEDAGDLSTEREAAPSLAAGAAPGSESSGTEAHPWDDLFGGLTGRILESGGAPVEGIRVDLLEFDITTLADVEHRPLGVDDVVIAGATTDADGRFMIRRARASGIHGLSIDPGGHRSTLRFVEQSVEYGKLTDLGDIVLEASATVFGSVVDEDGEPVTGARVRFGLVPEVAAQSGALDVREDSVLSFGTADETFVLDLLPYAKRLEGRLPFSTGYTKEDGSFRIVGVPIGLVSGGVDCRGHVGTPVNGFELRVGDHDIGEVELLFGREVTAHVKDAAGEPVVDAEVMLGIQHPVLPFGLFQPATPSDVDGVYATPALSEEGTAIAIARRSARDEWTFVAALGSSDSIEVILTSTAPLLIEVTDAEGVPLEDVEFVLRGGAAPGDFVRSAALEFVTKCDTTPVDARALQPGQYIIDDVPLDWWQIKANAPGLAQATVDHEHLGADGPAAKLVMEPGTTLNVRVVDAATGDAVPNAHVRAVMPMGSSFDIASSAWTGADGRAQIGPLVHKERREGGFIAVMMASDYMLMVEHPRHAPSKVPIEIDSTVDAGELLVELVAPSAIVGRVTWAGKVPETRYMLVLEDDSDIGSGVMAPRFGLSNVDGTFRIGSLSAGSYDMTVSERFIEGNPIIALVQSSGPKERIRVPVEVLPGEDTVLEVELSASGEALPGWFEGRVTLDGRPLAGAVVAFEKGDAPDVSTNGDGEFKSTELPAQESIRVSITADVVNPLGETSNETLYSEWTSTHAGRGHRIEVDVSFAMLSVEVLDAATGGAIEGASVYGAGKSAVHDTETDATGILETYIRLVGDAPKLFVTAENYKRVEVPLPIVDGQIRETITVRLTRTTPFAGKAYMPQGMAGAGSQSLMVSPIGQVDNRSIWLYGDETEPGILSFESDELVPGKYVAILWGTEGKNSQVEFELGPEGDMNVVFEFRKKD